jgi:hypothetical protein
MIATVLDFPQGRTERAIHVRTFVGERAHDLAAEFIDAQPDAAPWYRYKLRASQGTRIAGIQVRDLIPGDVLLPSGTSVLSRPVAGARTPRGKVELSIAGRSGRQRVATWGRYTKVTIIRHTEGA